MHEEAAVFGLSMQGEIERWPINSPHGLICLATYVCTCVYVRVRERERIIASEQQLHIDILCPHTVNDFILSYI